MDIAIRALAERDLAQADHIFRLAFGTFLQLPDPLSFMGDADLVKSRWRTDPDAALGAYINDALVGSSFAANWGSFGFLGPVTVRPDLWDRGIARRLLGATMEILARWKIRQAGLFTFPHSPKHLSLYQSFGFWPQALTPVMMKAVNAEPVDGVALYSALSSDKREPCLAACAAITSALLPGLDVAREIRSVATQRIGDTVLLNEKGGLVGFAICHLGGGSEAGSGAAYVKFGAVQPGTHARRNFDRLVAGCETLAAARGLGQLIAGANCARHDAYRLLLERGYRIFLPGVAMQRPQEAGLNRPDCFVIDDWR